MKSRYLWLSLMCFLVLSGPPPAWSGRMIEVEGVGPSREAAILDAKRTAVEQVVGVYLMSLTQVKDFIIKNDTIMTESAGFIKSYQVISSNSSQGMHSCRLRVEVEPDENKIAVFLRRLLGKKTFTVHVREYVEGRTLRDQSLYHSLTKELTRKGYYLVRDSRMEPFYRITAIAASRPPAKSTRGSAHVPRAARGSRTAGSTGTGRGSPRGSPDRAVRATGSAPRSAARSATRPCR